MLSRLKITHHSLLTVSFKPPIKIKSFSALAMARTIEKNFQAAIDSGQINGGIICATNSKGDFTYNKALGQRTLLSGEKRPQ
ncbi:transesterase [Fusarium fujikuroi]|nr:transesterase [Fusarium fujikuroi]